VRLELAGLAAVRDHGLERCGMSLQPHHHLHVALDSAERHAEVS
jgi:hypothetical protein